MTRRGFLVLAGAGAASVRAQGAAPLQVGMELAYAPFEMTDAQGRPAGVSVDLAEALGAELGRAVEIRNLPFEGLIPALKTGRIDLIISSMTATPERARSIDFSEPYVRTGLSLLLAAGCKARDVAALDAAEFRVAVKKGTTGHLYAVAKLKRAKVLVFDKENACVLEVRQGKADAFIYDQLSVYRAWKRDADVFRPNLTAFQEETWAVGVRKGNDALRGQVNAFLAKFRASGGFERLAEKHLAVERAGFRELGIPFLF
jgi:polar amino acid transport system substrate-binding protein